VKQDKNRDSLTPTALENIRTLDFLDSVIENLPTMVFIKDARDLRFLRLNRACEEAIGFSRDFILGKTAHDFLPKEEADFIAERDREALESGMVLDIPEETIHTKSGDVRVLHARKIPLLDAQGNSQYLLGISEDVTELKKTREALVTAKEEAERSNRFKDQFLSTMSHELRTPLNAVVGFSDLLSEEHYGPLNDRQMRYVNHIRAGGKHLLRLINDILDLSRIEAGRLQLAIENVPVRQSLVEVIDTMRPLADKKSQTLCHESVSDVAVKADSTRFKQILMNLIGNAVKFTPEGGKIELKVKEFDEIVRVEVHDSGPGIAPEEQKRIFEAFYRLSHAEKSTEGTGLGLAITQRLVELQGGQLGIESDLGRGSCFHFTMPIVPESVIARREGAFTALGSYEPPCIMVVEDDPAAAQILELHLTSAGYRVAICDNPGRALEMAAKIQPSAMTVDILMGPVNGWELLSKIKSDSRTRKIPAIVVTIVDQPGTGALLGADEYIVKPVEKAALLAAIGRCLNRRGRRERLQPILVVEDDDATREFIAEILSKNGFSVRTAADAQGARAHMIASPPELVVLDLILPTVSGFQLLTEWRQDPRTADIPVFVLTSKDLTLDEQNYLRSNAAALFHKQEVWQDALVRQLQRTLPASATTLA
jgi:PAS domain S-box-containing protein